MTADTRVGQQHGALGNFIIGVKMNQVTVFNRSINMATGKNTKGKANNGGSQANVQHDGLMTLESRVLFSAVPLVSELALPEPSNDGAAAIEAVRLPGESHSVINPDSMRPVDNPEGSNPTPHPMPVPETFFTDCPIVLYAEEGSGQTPVVLENKDASPASALTESKSKMEYWLRSKSLLSVDAVREINRLGGQEGEPIVDTAHIVQQRSGQTSRFDVGALGIMGANYDKPHATYDDGDLNEDGVVDIADLGILGSKWKLVAASDIPVNTTDATPLSERVVIKYQQTPRGNSLYHDWCGHHDC